MLNKYKFQLVIFNPDTIELQSKCWGMKKYYLEDWLNTYNLNYYISKRERTGKVWYVGHSKRDFKIETEKVDWRWTIYNIKVIGIKSMKNYFKITFKCRLTPKEAFVLGEELKELSYNNECLYKRIVKGQHGC